MQKPRAFERRSLRKRIPGRHSGGVQSDRAQEGEGRQVIRYLCAILCVLLLAGCAGKRAGRPADGKVETVVTHRVGYGETWESISLDFYGEQERADDLAVYNGFSPGEAPDVGSGVRIPLSKQDLRLLRGTLDAVAVNNEGLDLAAHGNYAEAVQRFEKALEIDPDFSDATYNLAVTYQKLGLHEKAAACLEELILVDKNDSRYHYALGASRFHQGQYRGAVKSFEKSLALDPDNLKSLFSLAAVYEKMGKEEKAARLFQEYIDRDPGGEWADEARERLVKLVRPGGGTP